MNPILSGTSESEKPIFSGKRLQYQWTGLKVPLSKGTFMQLKKNFWVLAAPVTDSFHRTYSATVCIYCVREQRKYWAAISRSPLPNVVTRIIICIEAFKLWRSSSFSLLLPVISSLLHPSIYSADHYVNKYIVSLQRENGMCFVSVGHADWAVRKWVHVPHECVAYCTPQSCQPAMLHSMQNT